MKKKLLMFIIFLILIIICGNTAVLSQEQSSYNVKELSRDGDYKIMEMYVYGNEEKLSRKITFELPAEWRAEGSVFTNDEDWIYTMKVDMWGIKNSTMENVLDEYNERDEWINVIYENIYSVENRKIFHYKCYGEAAIFINVYYIYLNGERFCMSSYVFHEAKPEYDDIFKRIVESVKFQPDGNGGVFSPATGDNIFIYIIVLFFLSAVLAAKKACPKIKFIAQF